MIGAIVRGVAAALFGLAWMLWAYIGATGFYDAQPCIGDTIAAIELTLAGAGTLALAGAIVFDLFDRGKPRRVARRGAGVLLVLWTVLMLLTATC